MLQDRTGEGTWNGVAGGGEGAEVGGGVVTTKE